MPHRRDPSSVILPPWATFAFSSTAPMIAVVATNPFDVAKVRMMLQQSPKDGTARVYKNSLHCIRKVGSKEGILALEKGLATAMLREGSKNFFRIGFYQPILNLMHSEKDKSAPMYKRMVAGATSGVLGAVACNPFEIIKTRMQAQGVTSTGHQHNYTGVGNAITTISKHEGVGGLYKGTSLSMVRAALGSGINLATYSWLREKVLREEIMKDGPLTDMCCSLTSALFAAIGMNPVDVLRTRFYNQPVDPLTGKGTLYKNGLDAFRVVVASEGPQALFKGVVPSFMRLGPHFCLTFVILEAMRRHSKQYISTANWNAQVLSLFTSMDENNDGEVDRVELVSALKTLIPRRDGHAAMRYDGTSFTEVEYDSHIQREADRFMALADVDDSGTLSLGEFETIADGVSEMLRISELKKIFDTLDKDGNGSLDGDELVLALKYASILGGAETELQRHLHSTAEAHDTLIRNDVARMMKYADTDRSGAICFAEFLKVSDRLVDLQEGRVLETWLRQAGTATE
eukprot:TRINITY_DN767_c0_g1_i1.p1 TRINITY_DN767_c0_g1~~TRINITY_DN767_c0_g1_i1.p1  ORF type:complete len:516 (+),score=80.60 TRINITY_DN767_c0_g1_i1:350-1897(+)